MRKRQNIKKLIIPLFRQPVVRGMLPTLQKKIMTTKNMTWAWVYKSMESLSGANNWLIGQTIICWL